MHTRGCPTPSPSDPGDRAGGKGRTRGKNAAATSAVPAQSSGTGTGYGVGGTQTMGSEGSTGFRAASGRADIAGAPSRGEGPLLLPVAAIPIPTHTRWVHWSQGRAIAGRSFGSPPAAQAPSCPCPHGLGGAEALLVLPHSGLVWREGTVAGGLPCTPRGARMVTATGPQMHRAQAGGSEGCSSAFWVLSFTHLHQSSLEPAHAKCLCRMWVPPACAGDPLPRRVGGQWPRRRAPCHGQLVAQSTAGMEGARVGVPQPQELLHGRVLSPPVLRSPGGRPSHGTKRGSRGEAHMLSASW